MEKWYFEFLTLGFVAQKAKTLYHADPHAIKFLKGMFVLLWHGENDILTNNNASVFFFVPKKIKKLLTCRGRSNRRFP
jgi:hypothetical protein